MTDLLVNINECELGSVFFYNTITEAVVNSIPDSIRKHFEKKENRQKLLDEFGEKAFLLPKELKFPVVNPFTKEFDCRLIYAARIRAKQHKYPEVDKKATALYKEHNCENQINITLNDVELNTEFSCEELFEIFDFDHSIILENQEAYKKVYNDTLKDFNVKSFTELSDEQKKTFFNSLEKRWTKEPKEK